MNCLLPENLIKIIKPIGTGSYGQVSLCEILDENLKESEKIVKRNYIDEPIDFIGSIRELDLMTKAKHPFILSYVYLSTGKIHNEQNSFHRYKPDEIYFIMSRGSYDCHHMIYSRRASLRVLKEAFVHITLGTSYLNSLGYLHADLKPRNCIWFNENGKRKMKVADFGLSRPNFKNLPKPVFTMTPCYRAPEIIRENRYYDGEKIDSWGLGCILYEMFTGEPYLNSSSSSNSILASKINQLPLTRSDFQKKCFDSQDQIESFDRTFGRNKRSELLDLLEKLFRRNPEKRISPKQVLDHPFLSDHQELIQETLASYPPPEQNQIIRIVSSDQSELRSRRDNFCNLLQRNLTHAKNPFDTQYIFHALRIFDELIDLMPEEDYPVNNREWSVFNHTCLYISRKYFDEEDIYSFQIFCSSRFYNKYYDSVRAMELYLLNDHLEFQVYQKSLFEAIFDDHSDIAVVEQNIYKLFHYYSSLEGEFNLDELSDSLITVMSPETRFANQMSFELEPTNHLADSLDRLPNIEKNIRSVLHRKKTKHFTTRVDTHAPIGDYTMR